MHLATNRTLHLGAGLVMAALVSLGGCFQGTAPASSSEGADAASKSGSAEGATQFPLSRLTRAQYQNSLRDLFGAAAVDGVALPPADVSVEGFDNNTAAQTPSAALIEAYQTAAAEVATIALAEPQALLKCVPQSRPDEDACAMAFFGTYGKRIYRKPMAPADVQSLQDFYASRRDAGSDFVSAMRLSLQAMLQSPEFLYRVEVGAPVATRPGVVQLLPYEMASRLSYLLWNSTPDDALFAAADAGELATPEGLEKQARRLLAEPRSHAAMRAFYSQWLRFDKMKNLSKDKEMFPTFGTATLTSMQDSADKFMEGVFFGGGTLTTLLTDNHAWVNDTLAPLYGVPAPGGAELKLVTVDATQRSGILTDVGMMAGFAHETADAPVLRGVFVLDRLLCSPPPPPPPDIPAAPTPSASEPKTTRERFALQHEQGACAGCHRDIDGIGFGFSHYDATGQWRTTDSGFPVDASGWFASGSGLEGTFHGAVELGQRLATSPTVQTCVASQWMRYALGVDADGLEEAQVKPVVDAFVASGSKMQELAVAFTKSDAFRMRTVQK